MDGDQSTNDTVLLLANGATGADQVLSGGVRLKNKAIVAAALEGSDLTPEAVTQALTQARQTEGAEEIVALANGKEFVTAISRRFPAGQPLDLVILDLEMPEMDGLELVRAVRHSHPQMPVILMTAYDDLPTVATAMREGAGDFHPLLNSKRQVRHFVIPVGFKLQKS